MDLSDQILQTEVLRLILMLFLKLSSFFILTIHATKDQEAHHKSGYSKYVSDDESKVKVRFSIFYWRTVQTASGVRSVGPAVSPLSFESIRSFGFEFIRSLC